ncbi:MAG TPA: cytochrome c-type biogenesis protein CcmH [Candidatus Limnocylindria bacterium]|nr:cytochrome c-type biogenesis protein CcmH [Candidatus Limnocylindria bacterium]
MRPRLLLASVLALVVATGAAAVLLAGAGTGSDAARAERLAAELRCPDCAALSVADSHTRAADAIRGEIERLVAEGRSDEEVRRHFVDRYGQWILLAPGDPLAWWAPVLAAAVGIAAFSVWMTRSPRARPAASGAPAATPPVADVSRVREELEALDG